MPVYDPTSHTPALPNAGLPSAATKPRIRPLFLMLSLLALPLAACQSNDFADTDPALTQVGEPAVSPQAPQREITKAELTVLAAVDPLVDDDLRNRALLQIANSSAGSAPQYLDLYRALINHPDTDPLLAATSADALARLGEPDDTQFITPLLTSDEPYTRWQAAVALQKLHNPAAVPALIRCATTDEDADARAAAADALGQYPRRDVFDALLGALDDRDFGVSHAAGRSLSLLTDYDAGDDPRAWLDYANANPATLFANPQPYTYDPYAHGNFWESLFLFWVNFDPPPQAPTGYPTP